MWYPEKLKIGDEAVKCVSGNGIMVLKNLVITDIGTASWTGGSYKLKLRFFRSGMDVSGVPLEVWVVGVNDRISSEKVMIGSLELHKFISEVHGYYQSKDGSVRLLEHIMFHSSVGENRHTGHPNRLLYSVETLEHPLITDVLTEALGNIGTDEFIKALKGLERSLDQQNLYTQLLRQPSGLSNVRGVKITRVLMHAKNEMELSCILKVDDAGSFVVQCRKLASEEYCWCSSISDLQYFISSIMGKPFLEEQKCEDLMNWLADNDAMVTGEDNGQPLVKIICPIGILPAENLSESLLTEIWGGICSRLRTLSAAVIY